MSIFRPTEKMDQVETKILQFLREALPTQSAKMEIRPEMSLQKDLGIDSLAIVAFAVRMGEEFGVDLNKFADNIADVRTVNDVMVAAKLLIEQAKGA